MDAIVTPKVDRKDKINDLVNTLIDRSIEINELKLQLSLAQKKIARLELVWKKGRPEKDGWYWVCEDGFQHQEDCYEVIKVGSNENALWFRGSNFYSSWDNFLFAGPIEFPKELSKQD